MSGERCKFCWRCERCGKPDVIGHPNEPPCQCPPPATPGPSIIESRVAVLEEALREYGTAMTLLWSAVDNGDVCFIHYPDEDPKGEVYGIDCPEDDTCECHSRDVATLLSRAHDIGRRTLSGDKGTP